jgi:Xaa-Pro aminopeptidase
MGDLVLIDFGACFRHYNADLTRTISCGIISNKIRQIYEAVKEANKVGIDSIETGVLASDVHKRVSESLASNGLGDRFIHATGHSIGLSVHDGYKINNKSNIILKEGMAFTIEPGVYLPGIGGVRIEDDLIVRNNGAEVLTNISKELIEI